jgi:hypothetical protein
MAAAAWNDGGSSASRRICNGVKAHLSMYECLSNGWLSRLCTMADWRNDWRGVYFYSAYHYEMAAMTSMKLLIRSWKRQYQCVGYRWKRVMASIASNTMALLFCRNVSYSNQWWLFVISSLCNGLCVLNTMSMLYYSISINVWNVTMAVTDILC